MLSQQPNQFVTDVDYQVIDNLDGSNIGARGRWNLDRLATRGQNVSETNQETAPMRDSETAEGQCRSCKTDTTMRFRVKKSWFGLKKEEFWACTRCGNTQDNLAS